MAFLSAAPNNGLIGYWPFDEGSGTIIHDYSGNNDHGNMIGPVVWDSSSNNIVRGALKMNGNDSYVKIGKPAPLINLTGNISISAWVKFNAYSPGGNDSTIVDRMLGSPTFASSYTLRASHDLGQLLFILYMSNSNSSISLGKYSLTSPILNVWYHVVATYNIGNQKAHMYVNGIEENGIYNQTGLLTSIYESGGDINIGRPYNQDSNSADKLWDGWIGEVRIYNRELSNSEVAALYNSKIPNISGRTTLILDNFDRANLDPIGSNWVPVTSNGNAKIVSNQVTSSAGGDAAQIYTAISPNANQWSECYVTADCGPAVRVSSSAWTGYFMWSGADVTSPTGYIWVVDRVINGTTLTQVAKWPEDITTLKKFRLEVRGTGAVVSIKVFKNDILIIDIQDTDATRIVSAGNLGFYVNGGNYVDNWQGGNLTN
jgi:hypothetical protein